MEVDVCGSAIAIVERKRMRGALRLCNYEKFAEGCCMGVAIVTFLQVLVLLQEDIDQKHSSAFFGQHTNDTKETLRIEQGKCVGNLCVASDTIPPSPTSGTRKRLKKLLHLTQSPNPQNPGL